MLLPHSMLLPASPCSLSASLSRSHWLGERCWNSVRAANEDSVKEFEAGLKTLQAGSPTPEIRDNYQLLEQLFEEFKGPTAKPAILENAKPFSEQNEELVWIATKGAQLFQQHSKSVRSDLIGTAGEMRTLTQRIAKLYLFRSGASVQKLSPTI